MCVDLKDYKDICHIWVLVIPLRHTSTGWKNDLSDPALMLAYCTGCYRIRYPSLKIYCDETNRNIGTLFTTEHMLTLQVIFTMLNKADLIMRRTYRRYSNSSRKFLKTFTSAGRIALSCHGISWRSTGVGGIYTLYHEPTKWKVHGRQMRWSEWSRNVAATTCPSSRECLVQVPRHIPVIVGVAPPCCQVTLLRAV
jgi:hypothetical protein